MDKKLIICNQCKILFEKSSIACPVCRTNNSEFGESLEVDNEDKPRQEEQMFNVGWKRMFLILTLFMALIPCIIMLSLDFFQNKGMSWSLLIVLSITVGWMYLFLLVTLFKKPIILGISFFLLTVLFLYLINLLRETDWFVFFGMPLSIGVLVISCLTLFVIKKSIHRGFNTMAILLIGIVLILVFIEILYSYFMFLHIRLIWSLVIVGGCIPLIFILFYLHKNRKVMERWFHF